MNRGFNISEWALAHRSFVWFLVVIIVAAGGLSYLRLGRNEDPNFTIKTMVGAARRRHRADVRTSGAHPIRPARIGTTLRDSSA
jgi:hypothetical protein